MPEGAMVTLKICLEAETEEEVKTAVDELRKQLNITSVVGLPYFEENCYVQHIVAQISTK